MPDPSPLTISPSLLGRYVFHDCERFLRYAAAGPQGDPEQGIPTRSYDSSPLMRAILASGYRWEREVLGGHLAGRVAIAPGEGELQDRRFGLEATLRQLAELPAGQALYQPSLRAPASFYQRYGLDPARIRVSDNHPDLLEVHPDAGGGRRLRVVDLKRGESLRLTHRVQIAFYALELDAVLHEAGIPDLRADLDEGAVWLGGQPEPLAFDLQDVIPHLEQLLSGALPRILGAPPEAAHWHLYFRCEWCPYLEHCRDEMRAADDLSRIERLSSAGKRFLREQAGARSVTELGAFLSRPDADRVLAESATLAGRGPRLRRQVEAHLAGEPRPHDAASLALPRGENVAVVLTLQREPLGGEIYLAGLLANARAEVAEALGGEGFGRPRVFVAERPEAVGAMRRDFVTALHALLARVEAYNQDLDWRDQLSLQLYVHSEQSRALLVQLLLEALREPGLAEPAMALLLHVQGPELMLTDAHPEETAAFPVVVLLDALGQLLALPVDVSYTLPESLAALGSRFDYPRNDYYHFPLGHGLRAEAIHGAWYRGKRANVEDVRKAAGSHLYAIRALLWDLRGRCREQLVAWPPKLALPGATPIADPLLSRLAFFTRYESLLRCTELREQRALPLEQQRLQERVVPLVALGGARFELEPGTSFNLDADGFPSWLLVRATPAGRQAQLRYRDYANRNVFWGGAGDPERAVVGIDRAEDDPLGFTRRIRLKLVGTFKDAPPPEAGERCLLYPRFTDYTSDRLIDFLTELDAAGGSEVIDILRRPAEAAQPQPLSAAALAAAAELEPALALTDSQRAAWRHILERRVTAVWGPPGTGKTHFLASAIAGLAEARARAGEPLHVLVTAFTHAAIENLLRKLAERREALGLAAELELAKVGGWKSPAPTGCGDCEPKALTGWLAERPLAVVGATVYGVLKDPPPGGFDLVLVDEASQVKVPEAAVPLSLVAPTGRLVLAGDDLQLPPIVAGVYPEPEDGDPVLHRSVFELFRGGQAAARTQAAEPGEDVTLQLHENFRMNDVLTGHAAALLYGPRYRCFDRAVAERRLRLAPPPDPAAADPLVEACLDPAYPLVLLVLEGLGAARANHPEAELTAALVDTLRERLRQEDSDQPFATDADFFAHGAVVVSPHHAQIRAIRAALAARRDWQAPPFVDTVDKIQGQEAEAVVVSYGVADAELALQEAEFIYGLERLNVAATRARAKTVLCLPAPLLEASPRVLEQEAAARGLAYMRALVTLVAEGGQALRFELGEGVTARLLRSGRAPG